jgi:hypothetical protein
VKKTRVKKGALIALNLALLAGCSSDRHSVIWHNFEKPGVQLEFDRPDSNSLEKILSLGLDNLSASEIFNKEFTRELRKVIFSANMQDVPFSKGSYTNKIIPRIEIKVNRVSFGSYTGSRNAEILKTLIH